MSKESRAAKAEERKRFPMVYTGPGTKYGLRQGVRCRSASKGKGRGAGGGRMIETAAGGRFLVPAAQLEHRA